MAKRTERIMLIIFALICVFALFSLTLSVISNADHDCSGSSCPLCLCISARDTVTSLFSAIAFATLFVCVFTVIRGNVCDSSASFDGILVYLKVKLSN